MDRGCLDSLLSVLDLDSLFLQRRGPCRALPRAPPGKQSLTLRAQRWHEPCFLLSIEITGSKDMKHKDLYALTLTSAAMLCGTGTVASAQEHDGGPATEHSGTRNTSNAVRASKLVGATVKNKAGDSIGEISDLLVSPSASITTAIVSVGGVLGIGEKKTAVPYKSFSVSPDGKTAYLDMTAEQLRSMPAYTDDGELRRRTSQNDPLEHPTTSSSAATASTATATARELEAPPEFKCE
jgi:sporulation protein YlmC with PRC-barrel domain